MTTEGECDKVGLCFNGADEEDMCLFDCLNGGICKGDAGEYRDGAVCLCVVLCHMYLGVSVFHVCVCFL